MPSQPLRPGPAGRLFPWLLIAACTAVPEGSTKPDSFGPSGAAASGGSLVPPGAALCSTCVTSDDCGTLHDLCIVHASTKESFCGLQCGDGNPCPTGFSCVALPDAPRSQCVPESGSCQIPPQGPGGAGGGAAGTGGSAGSGGTQEPCDGACASRQYDACTCSQADPCGWVGDSRCDDACYAVAPVDHLDDSLDCGGAAGSGGGSTGGSGGGTTAPCDGECGEGRYTACTCDPSDPCGWAADGYCDSNCYDSYPGNHFDDTADCGEPPGEVCDGDCANAYYTACTCSHADPCGWTGDGYCDAECYDLYPYDHYSDWQDCGY